MYQNTCVDFKLGYADAKSYSSAFCLETYLSGSFIKNRANMKCKIGFLNIVLFFVPVLPFFILSYLAVLHVIGLYITILHFVVMPVIGVWCQICRSVSSLVSDLGHLENNNIFLITNNFYFSFTLLYL